MDLNGFEWMELMELMEWIGMDWSGLDWIGLD
jgi:hypothetical protein